MTAKTKQYTVRGWKFWVFVAAPWAFGWLSLIRLVLQ